MSEVGSNPSIIVYFTQVNVAVSLPFEGDYTVLKGWENGMLLSTYFTPTEPKNRGFNVRGKLGANRLLLSQQLLSQHS